MTETDRSGKLSTIAAIAMFVLAGMFVFDLYADEYWWAVADLAGLLALRYFCLPHYEEFETP